MKLCIYRKSVLLKNSEDCLNLVIRIVLNKKSLKFLGADKNKFITSIKHFYRILSTKSTTKQSSILKK